MALCRKTPRIIGSTADIEAGVRHLRRVCPVMRAIHDRTGPPPLRRFDAGFEGLARIITGQQLSIASAAAIWGRLSAALQPFTPARLQSTTDAELAAHGLSGAKIRTLRALCESLQGGLDLDALATANDADIRAALTDVSGIGPWTADIYVLFCLGRADAWAAGDLALQVGAAQAFGSGERMSAAELESTAERWRPWRGVAARLIWADYAHQRRVRAPERGPRERTRRLSEISKKP